MNVLIERAHSIVCGMILTRTSETCLDVEPVKSKIHLHVCDYSRDMAADKFVEIQSVLKDKDTSKTTV